MVTRGWKKLDPSVVILFVGLVISSLALLLLFAFAPQEALARPLQDDCGNGQCEPKEDCDSCPQDCGPCNQGDDDDDDDAECGNEIVEPGEACDGMGQDECRDNYVCQGCRCVPGYCGDWVHQPDLGEECDGGFGCPEGVVCSPDCTCGGAAAGGVCGDGIVNQPSEQCDGADQGICNTPCTPDCTCSQQAGGCGDGVWDAATEECDETFGGGQGQCPNGETCRNCTCGGTAVGFCGDGVWDAASEACDASFNDGEGQCPEGSSCSDACTCLETVGPNFCGDGEQQEGEECGEPGLTCEGDSVCDEETCTCRPPWPWGSACGNGLPDAAEECDPPGLTCAEDEWCELATCTCVPPEENCLTVDPDRIERRTHTEEGITLSPEDAAALGLGVECCVEGACDITFSVEYYIGADGLPVVCGTGVTAACEVIRLEPLDCLTVDPALMEVYTEYHEDFALPEDVARAYGIECCIDGTCDIVETREFFIDPGGGAHICSYDMTGTCEPVPTWPWDDPSSSGRSGPGLMCIDVYDVEAFQDSLVVDGTVVDYDSIVLLECQIPDPSETNLTIQNGAFPPDITVPIFTSITWTNADPDMHSVTADDGWFDSGPLSEGQSFMLDFNLYGEYPYHSEGEPGMTGVIRVVPECVQKHLELRYGGLQVCGLCEGDWCGFGPGWPECSLVPYGDMPDLWQARYDRVAGEAPPEAANLSGGVFALACPSPPEGHVCIPIDAAMQAAYEEGNVTLADCFSGDANDTTDCPTLSQEFQLEQDDSGQQYLCFDAGPDEGFEPSCGPEPTDPVNGCAFSYLEGGSSAGGNTLLGRLLPGGLPGVLAADSEGGPSSGLILVFVAVALLGLGVLVVVVLVGLRRRAGQ